MIRKILGKLFRNNNKVYVPLRCRLGNQMFEYAMARATALDTGGRPVLYKYDEQPFLLDGFLLTPELEYADCSYYSICNKIGYWLKRKFLSEPKSSPARFAQEKRNKWWLALFGLFFCDTGYIAPLILLMRKRNIHCFGWFQSEKYFSRHEDVIRRELSFKPEIITRCESLACEIRNCESVCLHVRLGDYLDPKNSVFRVCTREYYDCAVQYIKRCKPESVFYIFTDSPDIFQREFPMNDVKLIPELYSPTESIYLGSQCKHHIMSNSSFSWWMQYLGKSADQVVIAPVRWFNNNQVTDGLYQDHWILM